MQAKDSPISGDGQDAHSFETSLMELQRIVGELEDGSLGLEESMRRFERGIGLLRGCYRILEQAEQKIEILTGLDAQGNPIVADFDAEAAAEPSRPPAGRRPRKPRDAASRDEVDTGAAPEEPEEGTRLF